MTNNSRQKKSLTIVITGASSGVGRATAHAFARKNAKIGLIARDRNSLEKTLQEVQALGGEGVILPADVSDPIGVELAAEKVEEVFGPIDIWINNAMVSMMAAFDQMTPKEFERITQVTYLGYAWGTQAALKRMKKRNRGVIVQVGSALAHRSIPLQSAYCAAKHAILGLTESIRCELLHEKSKVKITMVQLPGVNTPQFRWVRSRMPFKSKPVGAIFQPEVAANAILWASLHPRKEFLVGWPTVQAVVGNRLFSSWLDRYLAYKVYRDHFTDELESNQRPDNLFSSVPTDYGVEGPYSSEAQTRSLEFMISKNKHWLYLAGALSSALFLLQRSKALKTGASV